MDPRVTEPTTMATDYLLAAALFWWALSVLSRGGYHVPGRLAWAASFLATAAAALLGGTWHGFRMYFSTAAAEFLWSATEIWIGLAALLTIGAGLASALRPEVRGPERAAGLRRLKIGLGLTLAGLAVLLVPVSLHQRFNQNDLFHLTQLAAFWFWRRSLEGNHPIGAQRSTWECQSPESGP